MHNITKFLIILFFASSCSSDKNHHENKASNSDSLKKESQEMKKTEESKAESNTDTTSNTSDTFSAYLNSYKELSLPAIMVPRDLQVQEEDLTGIDTAHQKKYIKPYTTKISENDYPYNFNYPDFSSNNYKAAGKISLNSNVTLAVFSLIYESYTFIGIIAYDKAGKILDGKMISEEEGGSEVTYLLKSNIEKTENTITINSDYVEKHYAASGKVNKQNPIKKKYIFNLTSNKFEEVK